MTNDETRCANAAPESMYVFLLSSLLFMPSSPSSGLQAPEIFLGTSSFLGVDLSVSPLSVRQVDSKSRVRIHCGASRSLLPRWMNWAQDGKEDGRTCSIFGQYVPANDNPAFFLLTTLPYRRSILPKENKHLCKGTTHMQRGYCRHLPSGTRLGASCGQISHCRQHMWL